MSPWDDVLLRIQILCLIELKTDNHVWGYIFLCLLPYNFELLVIRNQNHHALKC